jgi:hypothetical protein
VQTIIEVENHKNTHELTTVFSYLEEAARLIDGELQYGQREKSLAVETSC